MTEPTVPYEAGPEPVEPTITLPLADVLRIESVLGQLIAGGYVRRACIAQACLVCEVSPAEFRAALLRLQAALMRRGGADAR